VEFWRYVDTPVDSPGAPTRETTGLEELGPGHAVGLDVDASDLNGEALSTRRQTITKGDLTFFDTNIKGKIIVYNASRSRVDISRIAPGRVKCQVTFTEGSTRRGIRTPAKG
jgi:hypothetical protein